MGNMSGVYAVFWWGDLTERDHLKDKGVDVRIILKLIFKNWVVEYGFD